MKYFILHMDLDSFFVSVERLKNPSLIGKPVIIGGANKRGVVSSCSYEAREFGVRSAMPGYKAKELCPNGIFISGNYKDYSIYSKKVTDVISNNVPLFEKASIDEFYIDLTGMDKYYGCYDFSKKLRSIIIEQTGLPISFGLGSNKIIAKMATNQAKPNGHLFIKHGQEITFLDPLPIKEIPSLGKKTQAFLKSRNINTIKQLREVGVENLESWLGKNGRSLWNKANGIGSVKINTEKVRKSISKETTFLEDEMDPKKLLDILNTMVDQLFHQLRKENLLASFITIKLRNPDFKTYSKQRGIAPTNYEQETRDEIKSLFFNLYKGQKIRLIGIKLSGLKNNEKQISLFNNNPKDEVIYKSLDDLKNRFGINGINRASNI